MRPGRRVFLYQERVKEEEQRLQWMINCNKQDDVFTAYCLARAKQHVVDYQTFGGEESLNLAELWGEIARQTKAGRYTIGDIRQQRERIQWERSSLNETIKLSSEQSQSSSPSMS